MTHSYSIVLDNRKDTGWQLPNIYTPNFLFKLWKYQFCSDRAQYTVRTWHICPTLELIEAVFFLTISTSTIRWLVTLFCKSLCVCRTVMCLCGTSTWLTSLVCFSCKLDLSSIEWLSDLQSLFFLLRSTRESLLDLLYPSTQTQLLLFSLFCSFPSIVGLHGE